MRPARTAPILLGVAVAVLAAAPASAHTGADPPRAAAGATKKKPKKAKQCRKGTVPVTVLRRRTCRSVKRALPAPKQGDRRVSLFNAALGSSLEGVRDRRGRRAPSIRSMFRRVSPAAQATLLRAVPGALARLDRLSGASAAAAHRDGGRRRTGRAAAGSDTYTITGPGGLQIDIRLVVGQQLTAEFALTRPQADGYRLRTTYRVPGDTSRFGFKGSSCPTPEGVLDAKDLIETAITTELLDPDGGIDSYYTVALRDRTTMRGQTADDAKLEHIDLTDKLEISETTGGSALGQIQLDAEFRRTTRINMRTSPPSYVPEQSSASVSARLTGILRIFQSSFTAGATARVQRAADQGFAGTVQKAIDDYRGRENAWQAPGTCATLKFDPATDSLAPLADGASGTVTAKIEANAGGVAAKAKWTLTAQANGAITPGTAQGGSTPFRYTVTRTGRNIRLSGSFKATSTAGVAEGTWTQKTREPGPDAYYVVDAVNYDANHSSTSSQAQNTICNVDGTVHESLHVNTPRPFKPDINKLTFSEGGAYGGTITLEPGDTDATRTGVVHGCDISVDPPPPACDVDVNLSVPVGIGVIVQIAARSTEAKVTWILPAVVVGDSGPAFPCYGPTFVATPNIEERTVPADQILTPGSHTLMVTRNVNFSAPFGSINGSTGASITFHRVNADGSAHTG